MAALSGRKSIGEIIDEVACINRAVEFPLRMCDEWIDDAEAESD
jgi:hypothetical protein